MDELWATLQATLQNDNDARRAAEKRLGEVRAPFGSFAPQAAGWSLNIDTMLA